MALGDTMMNQREPEIGSSDVIVLPASRSIATLLLLLLTFGVCVAPLFYIQRVWQAAIIAAYSLPGLLAIGLLLAVCIARAGTAPVPLKVFLPGLLFVIGGAAFDMAATILHSPDLSQEQNPIARALLDGGKSVPFVYAYAVTCQSLYIAFIVVLWAGLLRHRVTILGSMRGARSFVELVKAATGGFKLSWRQWCLPLHFSELPQTYHVLWMIAVILVSGSAHRWYLGLEWFGVCYGFGLWVWSISVIVGLSVYFLWLWRATQKAAA